MDIKMAANSALQSIEAGRQLSDEEVRSLERRVEVSEWPGVYDLVRAILIIADDISSLDATDALESLSYSYQSVLDQQILSHLGRETTESEVRELEHANSVCMAHIQEQLLILSDLEARQTSRETGADKWDISTNGT